MLWKESGMLLLSAPTVTSARKCAYNCYLKWIFRSCSSQKISTYLKLLHLIPPDCFYAWKKSGSSIWCVLYLKQKKPQNQSDCSKTDLEKETSFLSGPRKWQCNSLLGCFSSDLKKLPVGLPHSFACSVCAIDMNFMMQLSLRLTDGLWPPTPFTQAADELLQSHAF